MLGKVLHTDTVMLKPYTNNIKKIESTINKILNIEKNAYL